MISGSSDPIKSLSGGGQKREGFSGLALFGGVPGERLPIHKQHRALGQADLWVWAFSEKSTSASGIQKRNGLRGDSK